MPRLLLLVAILLLPATAGADVPRWGAGGRMTAQSDGDLAARLSGVHLRGRVAPRLSVELAVDLIRHREVLVHDHGDSPFADLLPPRSRRHATQIDLAARYHLVVHREADVYVLAGPGASYELINDEDECGDVLYNGSDGLRPRLVAGVGGELQSTLGDRNRIALGVELRGFALLGEGPHSGSVWEPEPMDSFGAALTATLTLSGR
jgi:hypothetical protein